MVHSAKKKIRKHRGVDESPLNNDVLNTILLVSELSLHVDSESTWTSYAGAFGLQPVADLKVSDVSSSVWIAFISFVRQPKLLEVCASLTELWTMLIVLIIGIAGMKPAVALWKKC